MELDSVTAYVYRAARSDGRIVNGTLQSAQATDAAATLMECGLFPISIEADTRNARSERSAPRRDLAILFRSIASLVAAGVPVDKALSASEAIARRRLKALLGGAVTALHEGESLAAALERTPGLVPPLAVGMIRAGERGGRLANALDEVATQLELEAEMLGKVRQALAYPILLAVVGAATIVVITTIVVPKFAELLDGAGQRLPSATRLLLAASHALGAWWWILLLAGFAVALSFRDWRRRPAGALRWHRWLLEAPLFGEIRSALATARCCHALSGMLQAGMPLLPALDALASAAGDRAVADRLARARELVAQGSTLTQSLERCRVFSSAPLQLIAVGELSGQLALMTSRAGHLAARHAERSIRTLVAALEPALIIGFGALVAFVASALLQAVYGLRAA
jgi:general secretion pathway protein F